MINLAQAEHEIANALQLINSKNEVSVEILAESFLNIISVIEPIISAYKSTHTSYKALKQDYDEREKIIENTDEVLSSYRIKLSQLESQLSELKKENQSLKDSQKYTTENRIRPALSMKENSYNEIQPSSISEAKQRYIEDQISSLWTSLCNKTGKISDAVHNQFGHQSDGEMLIKDQKYEEMLIKSLSTLIDLQKGETITVSSNNISPSIQKTAALRTSLEDYVCGIKNSKLSNVSVRKPPKPEKSGKKQNTSVISNDPSWLFENGLRKYSHAMTPNRVYNNYTKKTSGYFDEQIYHSVDECNSCKNRSKQNL
jgi:hypothetical protein